jgi:hypothetical protein
MFFSTRREGVRTSNDTLSKITKKHFVKIIVKLPMADYFENIIL